MRKTASTYRTDIDGVRAIAVISVILFHLGYLKNGYLGVDIFFVISGYLITGIIFKEINDNRFSIFKFYERRIRRILPLVLFTTLVAFILGVLLMLPDDLENLCQSIVASNFSANNILMYITSSDYWAVKNDYKPLMHTWSLGVEEQFYLFYPIIFLFLNKKKQFIFPVLIIFTVISVALFFTSGNFSSKFYFIQFRFFELSLGGICAIYFSAPKQHSYPLNSQFVLYFFILIIIYLLGFSSPFGNDFKVIATTISAAGLLVLGGFHFQHNNLYKKMLSNKLFVGIGKISFSLYMWHQIVFAFARYSLIEEMTLTYAIALLVLVVLLSLATYYFIENPFRNRNIIKTNLLLVIVGIFFFATSAMAFYVYAIGGMLRDVPELGLKTSNFSGKLNMFDSRSNIHIQYNEDIRSYDKDFTSKDKIKILVVGNSFARDYTNILSESTFNHKIELSYYDYAHKTANDKIISRFNSADFIFFSVDFLFTKEKFKQLRADYKIDERKVWVVGIKDFGNSNGIFYNKKNNIQNCTEDRAFMKKGIVEVNEKQKNEWGSKYIDLLGLISNNENKVLVFTPDCKFISQDTYHLTKFGAKFFSHLLEPKLLNILTPNKNNPF